MFKTIFNNDHTPSQGAYEIEKSIRAREEQRHWQPDYARTGEINSANWAGSANKARSVSMFANPKAVFQIVIGVFGK